MTIYQGSVTTSLSSETEGVHWRESRMVSSDLLSPDGTAIGLSAGAQDLVIAWWNASGDILLAFQQFGEDELMIWSNPINVSKSPIAKSLHQQVPLGGH